MTRRSVNKEIWKIHLFSVNVKINDPINFPIESQSNLITLMQQAIYFMDNENFYNQLIHK